MIGKLNHAVSDSSQGDFYDGGYTEAVIGYAYRPVMNDRVNALAKYTYFFNVPTTDQVTLQDTAAEFIQKSHVAAVDVTYDLNAVWSVGGKYAYRLGQISLEREDPQYFDNSAQLVIVRTDWRFRQGWRACWRPACSSCPTSTSAAPGHSPRFTDSSRAFQARYRLQLHRLLG